MYHAGYMLGLDVGGLSVYHHLDLEFDCKIYKYQYTLREFKVHRRTAIDCI